MLAIILVSYLMIVLDISIVITAMPDIDQGFGFSTGGCPETCEASSPVQNDPRL